MTLTVSLSGGPAPAQRFVVDGEKVTKEKVTEILKQFNVTVVKSCKDCDFVIVPDNVEHESESSMKRTHASGTQRHISEFLKSIEKGGPRKPISAAASNKKRTASSNKKKTPSQSNKKKTSTRKRSEDDEVEAAMQFYKEHRLKHMSSDFKRFLSVMLDEDDT